MYQTAEVSKLLIAKILMYKGKTLDQIELSDTEIVESDSNEDQDEDDDDSCLQIEGRKI